MRSYGQRAPLSLQIKSDQLWKACGSTSLVIRKKDLKKHVSPKWFCKDQLDVFLFFWREVSQCIRLLRAYLCPARCGQWAQPWASLPAVALARMQPSSECWDCLEPRNPHMAKSSLPKGSHSIFRVSTWVINRPFIYKMHQNPLDLISLLEHWFTALRWNLNIHKN